MEKHLSIQRILWLWNIGTDEHGHAESRRRVYLGSRRGFLSEWHNILAINGFQHVKIHTKTDQEPTIVAFQTPMQEIHPDRIIRINSSVGGSDCNGRAENAFRRAQDKVRVLRHHAESNIKGANARDEIVNGMARDIGDSVVFQIPPWRRRNITVRKSPKGRLCRTIGVIRRDGIFRIKGRSPQSKGEQSRRHLFCWEPLSGLRESKLTQGEESLRTELSIGSTMKKRGTKSKSCK